MEVGETSLGWRKTQHVRATEATENAMARPEAHAKEAGAAPAIRGHPEKCRSEGGTWKSVRLGALRRNFPCLSRRDGARSRTAVETSWLGSRHIGSPTLHTVKFLLRVLPWLALVVGRVYAQEPVTLSNGSGTSIVFTENEGGWRLGQLVLPGGPEGGWTVADREVEVGTPERLEMLRPDWTLVETGAARLVFEQEAPAVGLQVRRVYSFGPASNVLRVETWARSVAGGRVVAQIGLLNWKIFGEWFVEMGPAPASFPLFGDSMFAGIEHVSGEASTGGESVRLMQRPRLPVETEWKFIAAAVVGWPEPGADAGLPEGGRMRQAFIQYLDTVRIKPERMVLHSETWWTLMPPLYEKDVLADIDALKRGFLDRTGMFFDTYALDLGWSDPRSLWRIADGQFPNEFRVVNERLNALGTRLGMWFSPGSGYPDGLSNDWLQAQGYEMTPFGSGLPQVPCFALGTRYQREFREQAVAYARQYGLGHVILDFMAQRCDVATHGHPVGEESQYAIHAGVADVLDSLRAVNPNIALEPMVCGYPPSPWWLMKTPFILGPAGDDVPAGRVPSPEWMESLITARDVAYRAGQEAWLMPTQALETWDIVVQTPGDFENTAVMAIGRGRWFLSSYLKPSLMEPEDWDFFAALVRWARHNQQYLGNAWMIGGRPEDREAYGFMFRNGAKDLFCVRNPWIEERSIALPASVVATEALELRMIYPRRQTLARVEPGEALPAINLAAYETAFLETVPAGETTVAVAAASQVREAMLVAGTPLVEAGGDVSGIEERIGFTYTWGGMVDVPDDIEDTELHVLVEGDDTVDRTGCVIMLDGRPVKARRSMSAGQFSAASDASPENWAWFIVPVPKGRTTFQIDVRAPGGSSEIGVYLRGATHALNEQEPQGEPVFPVYRPDRRAWSQTLLPLQSYVAGSR